MSKIAGIVAVGLALASISMMTIAEDRAQSVLVNLTHTERWNRYADKMLELHKKIIGEHDIRTTEELGGYFRQPEFYKDIKYYDKKTDRLLSRVQWEVKNPKLVHSMEIYIHNKAGQVVRDYGVAYLTDGRNAPMQTMINFHSYPGKLHAFRQFDASNNRTFERCEGQYKGKSVYISLSEMDILEIEDLPKSIMTSVEYKKCFAGLPTTAGKYLTPQ